MFALKLAVAVTTFGSNDIAHWYDFTQGVQTAGPVGIYGLIFEKSFYNHPPLMGYFLWVVNRFTDLGIPYSFTIRLASCLADVGSAFLVFELLRRRGSLYRAVCAGTLVAISPVLFVVSGFHGNTDPVFVFLTLLSVYLLVDRLAPALAGATLALAVGIKIVPFVVVPILLVYAYRQRPRTAAWFAGAFLVVFALTWGPALIGQFDAVRKDVIGYGGVGYSLWGVMQFGHWMGDPGWVHFLAGPGRSLLVLVCALVPSVAVWRRPAVVLPAVAWSLILFLTLATTFGVQYLVWPVAVAYLVSLRLATIYSFTAGAVLIEVYNRWSGGLPWYHAVASAFTGLEKLLFLVPWFTLVLLSVQATRAIFPRRAGPAANRWPPVGGTDVTPAVVTGAAARRARMAIAPPREVSERTQYVAQDD